MHYGTFQLTDESIDAPLKDLEIAKQHYQIADFTVLKEGETRCFSL